VNASRAATRSAALQKIATDLSTKSSGPVELSKKDLNLAIGGFAVTAKNYVQKICTELNINFSVAPAEAEHQLIYWQQQGWLKAIFSNDSDYIVLGGTNIVLDSKRSCFGHGCKIWPGPSALEDARLLKKAIDGSISMDSKWTEVLLTHGFMSLQLIRCWAKSDYNYFPNIGMKKIIDLYFTIIQDLKTSGINVTTVTPAVMFEKMATLLEPLVVPEPQAVQLSEGVFFLNE
jgi:XPG I-region